MAEDAVHVPIKWAYRNLVCSTLIKRCLQTSQEDIYGLLGQVLHIFITLLLFSF